MEYSDEELFEICKEIDAIGIDIPGRAGEFIADMIDNTPVRLSDPQRDWIIILKEKYLA